MAIDWEDVHFSAHVNIKNIIGQELINNDNVAVMELVKNSYDAGAKKVTVEFKNLQNKDKKKHQIIISDDGTGMSKEDILQKWLNLAYSIKRVQNAQNNRLQAGNKGIGRFSCDRLGTKLDIYTKQDSIAYHLKINWEDFENIEDYSVQINKVPMQLREISDKEIKEDTSYKINKTGTIVKISYLRTKWIKLNDDSLFNDILNFQKIVSLKSTLEKLINKSQVESDNFKIFLKVDDIDDKTEESYNKKINGEIKNKFFEKLDFNTTYIQSAISEDGKYIITKLKDRDKTIFKTIEKNIDFPELKGVKIILMYLNPYGKVYFEKQMGIRSVDFGSVYLFINGFRIPPYGDIDNDSFGMEVRKNQGYSRYLSNRDIIGRIEIEDRNNQYKIISSREGIVEHESFRQLIHKSTTSKINQTKNNGFFYKTLKKLEKYVVESLKWDSVSRELTESKIKAMVGQKYWKENKETYIIRREEKLTNVCKKIFAIIKVDSKNIMDLYINTDVLLYLVEKETIKTQKNIIQFIKGFSKIPNYATGVKFKTFIKKLIKNIDDKDLLKKTEFILNNKIIDINNIIDKEESYRQLDKKIIVLEDEQLKLKLKLHNTEIEKEQFRNQKEQSEEQAKKLKKILSKDTKELVAFQHHIGLYANTAKDFVLDTIRKVKSEKFDKSDYLENLQIVILELGKIKIISKYIIREDYLSVEKKVNDDLVKFIFNYTKSIYESTTNREFNITINTNNIKYKCKYEPIKINIIIDNLLSNSKKEEIDAKNVTINFYNEDNHILLMEYLDDGKGLDKSIVNKDSIFDIAVSKTKGSGLGLYHIRELLNEMKSTISVVKQDKGIKFLIRFKL